MNSFRGQYCTYLNYFLINNSIAHLPSTFVQHLQLQQWLQDVWLVSTGFGLCTVHAGWYPTWKPRISIAPSCC